LQRKSKFEATLAWISTLLYRGAALGKAFGLSNGFELPEAPWRESPRYGTGRLCAIMWHSCSEWRV